MSSAKFYNTFSFLYPIIDLLIGNHKRLLAQHINNLPGNSLLEIGVGNGSHLNLYRTKKITAIDTSTVMSKAAQNRNPNIECLLMDGENLTFSDNTFDSAIFCHVLAVTDNPNRMLSEAYRVVTNRGYIIILNHFTPDNILGYIDRILSPVSKLLKLRSVFKQQDLDLLGLTMVKEISIGRFSYFKLLILQKP
jgi:phosphatidylethanolamine/phosphatidyl-N-methylethanolamine N-methyltransferase